MRVPGAMRVVIVGGPRCGKTTLAATLGLPTRHTDDVIGLGWSEASAEVATWLDAPGPWCIEGVAAARALRKWLAAHESGAPCDEIRLLWVPLVERTDGQERMALGIETVWCEISDELIARGVAVVSIEIECVAATA